MIGSWNKYLRSKETRVKVKKAYSKDSFKSINSYLGLKMKNAKNKK